MPGSRWSSRRMACGAPVVASATGGILEVVVDGETGYLVPFEPDVVTGLPVHGGQFASDLARRIAKLMADPARCKKFGQAGRKRVAETFAWEAIAAQTVGVVSEAGEESQVKTP
jgi:alpha-maltose-1-phosphate synthase